MKILTGGCRAFSAEDGQLSTLGNWTARTVSDYSPGLSPAVVNRGPQRCSTSPPANGKCRVDGFEYTISPGAAIFVPPGAVYNIENTGAETMRVVGWCCPEDLRRHVDGPPPARSGEPPRLLVHEDLREDIRAGQDRLYRYLVYPDVGCTDHPVRGMDSAQHSPGIFILEGRGIVHTDDESCEFGPGSSIYFEAYAINGGSWTRRCG